jgi:hypothetical protein
VTEVLNVGDQMRISVELIRDLHTNEPDEAIIVRVKEIRLQADGCKVLVLERAPERTH